MKELGGEEEGVNRRVPGSQAGERRVTVSLAVQTVIESWPPECS